ncbi:hypothetical protein IAD21_05106 [Abditibacteriota bacterium]|nr:hypothetical protein IAD21_05106 [Abditibacteriota bacterium]
MSSRQFLVPLFLAPFCLGGCGAVSTVRTAFEMPVAPTPSPRELARARETRAFDSLSKSVAKLNADMVRQILGTTPSKTGTATSTRQPLQPSPFAAQPADSLAGDLSRGANIPITPRAVAISILPARETAYSLLPPLGSNTTLTLPARRLYSSPLGSVGGGISESAQAFLESWAAREGLRRSDEELLGRRNLEDRIDLQAHSALPALDLSLVSPETQLELSNLRLKLIPLLQVPRAQRAQAAAEIEAIEARLNQIWEQETARQAALLRQSLIEIPARLRREGESVLTEQTRQSATQTQERLAQVHRDLATRLQLPTAPSLSMAEETAKSPNSAAVRAQLSAPIIGGLNSPPAATVAVSSGTSDIARRGANPPSRVPGAVATKNERIWRAAVR